MLSKPKGRRTPEPSETKTFVAACLLSHVSSSIFKLFTWTMLSCHSEQLIPAI